MDTALKNSILQTRERARQVNEAFEAERQDIERDMDLTNDARARRISELTDRKKVSLDELRNRETQLLSDAVLRAERKIYSARGSSPDALIAARDADERASRLDAQEDAAEMLTRALRSDDLVLAMAVARRALEAGWQAVLRTLEAERPDLAKPFAEIAEIEQYRGDFSRLTHYMAV